jgi:para-nitrobenzyl esterase
MGFIRWRAVRDRQEEDVIMTSSRIKTGLQFGSSRRNVIGHGSALLAGAMLATPNRALAARRKPVLVETVHGKLRGLRENGVAFFKGVHYAQSAGGKNRFMPPQPVIPWAGIRDATQFGPPCIQTNPDFEPWTDPMPGSEDCLVLNVWAPETALGRTKLPVMFWIHGGGYSFGSAGAPLYDLANLAAKGDVVAVSINHRLHGFGFTDLTAAGSEFAGTGNAGILDILAALRWVRSNISQFGGDPDNITVFGQSGGGSKIATMMGMPEGRGLFHKAINQSGPISRYRERDEALEMTERMFSLLGIARNDVAALQAVPADRLLDCFNKIMNEARGTGHPALKYAPVIDGYFLPSRPWEHSAPPGASAIPLLAGTTKDETIIYMPEYAFGPLGNDAAIGRAVIESTPAYTPDIGTVNGLVPFYRKTMGNPSDLELVLQISTDLSYWKEINKHATLQARAGAPVFAYRCDWETPCFGGMYAPHTMELPLVLGNLRYGAAWDGKDTDADRVAADPKGDRFRLSERMMAMWTNFARRGNPSTDELAWPNYTLEKRSIMLLDRECKVVDDLRGVVRMALPKCPPSAPMAQN